MGAFVIGLFKIKRFKSGFPFLHERNTNFIGALIALIIAFYYTIISLSADRLDGELNIASWLAVLGIIVCAILIIVWWRTGITKKYRDYLFSQEIEELKGIIAEKEARIVEIEKSNNYLSRQIHSDNKLISSLLSMVRRMSEEYSPELAADVLSELNRISAQRKDALHKYYKEAKKLPPTSVISLDTTLDYMKQKAYENNIEFDVIVTGNIKKMIKEKIEEERLRLITADLLENAIIAVKPCKTRKILFAIGIFEGFYEIRADDSGVDFEPETLRDLGKKQTTTHENEGGSGIGMMEIFDVMRETGASLEIKRLSECGFTKRVALKFDGAGEFRDKI
ncbi:MAG: hypothetical protein FWG70_09325 [Oscillospiraceae bacterium]|nr:hypothetical protein [Oscillospiraceae bacterium]